MTFGEIYTEITNRAGQGYANYAVRAQAAFWKGVLSLINTGEWREEDIRGLMKRSESEAYLGTEFPYSLAASTAITDDHVFTLKVGLMPGYPLNVGYTRLNEEILHRADYLSPLKRGGLKEVFYSLKYPQIVLKYDSSDSLLNTAWCYVQINWTGIARAYVEGVTLNAQSAQQFISQGFTERAIEEAVKLMAQET